MQAEYIITSMERRIFNSSEIGKLFRPEDESKNGMVTIVGGSELFHGAPLLSLTVASRIVDIVFFASPDPSVGETANLLKSRLSSFIWVPWEEVGEYIRKSDAVLIGPGLMRYRSESQNSKIKSQDWEIEDDAWQKTRDITKELLIKFRDKKWVIDAGSLQVMERDWIPEDSILTPNIKEYARLFGDMDIANASREYNCTIILKGKVDVVANHGEVVEVFGGNPGMSKGGTGDTLAGLVTALFAKNEAMLAASSASYVTKKSGEKLFESVGPFFNADDLANEVPQTLYELMK
jgi:hydroxyethylthiazole kinase-like uncharacterized protein yjeF